MKTKEELDALKEEVAILNKKLNELTDEELAQVSGGAREPHVGPVLDGSHDYKKGELTIPLE